MELQKNLLKAFNITFPFTDFLYLLQQEEYSLQRFWFWFPRFFFRRNLQKRDRLVYTQRVKSVFVLSVLIFLAIIFLVFSFSLLWLLCFGLACICIPFIVVISNLLLDPIYSNIKKRIIKKAGIYFESVRGEVKVVAITGSYGKTTVKNFTEQFLRHTYKTQIVPGNINSTIGIANWILNSFKGGTEVLIVEMDSYVPGRIRESALLVKPDISILTNVGDQHLQRYKTKEALAKTLFELFQFSRSDAVRLTNKVTFDHLNKLNLNTKNISVADSVNTNTKLSDSNISNLEFALFVAHLLKIPEEYIGSISQNLVLPDRRQSVGELFGFDGVDDSYNISFNTALAGIKEADRQAKLKNKKLLVITAGIPELGPEEKDRNKQLGKFLSENADKTFVLRSIYYADILRGFVDKDKVETFEGLSQAISRLHEKHSQGEWFVLLQPELTDLYY